MPTLRLASLRFAISPGGSSTGVPAEWNDMPASTVKCLQRALREEAHREFISVKDSNDCWTLCGFLRVSMKSLLWLWLIVAENTEEECETVFCTTGIKVPMVPYLNESCMSLSGMSSGPHGQASDPAHEFSSANMSNEVCYKFCCLHKSIYSALQRDHCVCFDSHSGSPADPVLKNVNCPGNSFSVFVVATVGTRSI